MDAEREILSEAGREELAMEEALAERGRERGRVTMASREESEMHLALDERAEKRTRLIMPVGSFFRFMLYPVGAFAGAWAFDEVGEAAGWIAVSLLPLILGDWIAAEIVERSTTMKF